MKAPAFRYARPETVEDALALLAHHGEDAAVLAGGQSLLAALNMRLSSPAVLVDINRIDALRGIEDRGEVIRIGALSRHVDVATSPLVRQHLPLIALAMPYVAHVAVRNRGTFGGSLALGDPAAEMPACAVALGARLVLRGPKGARTVAAEDFYQDLYTSDRAVDELLVEVELPKRPGWRFGFAELSRRQGDFAMVGLAAACRFDDRTVRELRLVYFGSEPCARLARHGSEAAAGRQLDKDAEAAILAAVEKDLDPMGNLQGRPDTKRHLAKVLTRRVLAELADAA